MGIIVTIIAFFAILGIIVLVHEAGHFVAARRGGIKVDEFGLGLPPRAIGFYKDENGRWKSVGPKAKEAPSTIWSLNWIPLGGFVKIKGEEGQEADDPDSFANKSIGRRMWVLSAGVLMNVILAAVLLTIGLMVGLPQVLDETELSPLAKVRDEKIQVVQVLEGSPADEAGLEVADSVVRIDGQAFSEIEELQDYVAGRVDQPIQLEIERSNEFVTTEVTPEILSEAGDRGAMGVALVRTGFVSYPWYVAWAYGLEQTVMMIVSVVVGFFMVIKSLVVEQQLIGEVYGPVGIATLVGDAVGLGFLYVLQFTAVLSVIIAVINYLPFPALDGGRVLFLIIEAIRKKPINQRFEAAMHNAGFALLMILVLIVTYRDIARISGGLFERIANFF